MSENVSGAERHFNEYEKGYGYPGAKEKVGV
jgi:hypothetical protein